jgi:hypothetical protein
MAHYDIAWLCVVLILFASIVNATHEGSNTTFEEAHRICLEDSVCRNLYGQDHGEVSLEAFKSTIGGLEGLQWAESMVRSRESAMAAAMALKQGVLSETRCGPNEHLFWDSSAQEATCLCYVDKDCSSRNVPLCYSNTHPILLAAFVLVALMVGAAIIQINARSRPIAPKQL